MDDIFSRKENLRRDIKQIEGGFQERISILTKSCKDVSNAKDYVKKRPFISFAAAAGAGFLVGMLRRKKRGSNAQSSSKDTLTSILFRELKQVAARKAMLHLSDLIDQKISSYQKKKPDGDL